MKMTLREALAQADNVYLDDYEVADFKYTSETTIRMERADEMEFEFPLDVVLDLSDGRAFTDDLEGEEHDLVFWLHRRLGEDPDDYQIPVQELRAETVPRRHYHGHRAPR